MTAELLANIEKYETAAADLRAVISEAHSTIKDLRVVMAELAKTQERMVEDAQQAVEKRIVEVVQERLDSMAPALENHMARSVEHINGEFKKLEKALFTGRDGVDLRVVAESLKEGYNPLVWEPPMPAAGVAKKKRRKR